VKKPVAYEEIGKKRIYQRHLEMEKIYTIAACERDGDPVDTLCRISKVNNPLSKEILWHEVIEEYLKPFSPIAPKLDGRAIATDAHQRC